MVSFRINQFRAILQGLVWVDAWNCGQVQWDPVGVTGQRVLRLSTLPADDSVSARWCYQIAEQLTQVTRSVPPIPPLLEALATAQTVTDLLAVLPLALLLCDRLPRGAAATAMPALQSPSVGLLFYQGLAGLLNGEALMVAESQAQIRAIAATNGSLAQRVALAFEHVEAAQGDFGLSVGQSCQTPDLPVGLPLLTGVLSAAQVGLAGLPVAVRQPLYAPAASLAGWLHNRWQVQNAATLDQWAQHLWQRWLGCEAKATANLDQLPVLPTLSVD